LRWCLAPVQAAVLGSVTGLLVRRAYLDPERRALLDAREAARTPAQVAAVQATTTPGRGWRRLGRYVGLSACVSGLVLLLAGQPVIGIVLPGCRDRHPGRPRLAWRPLLAGGCRQVSSCAASRPAVWARRRDARRVPHRGDAGHGCAAGLGAGRPPRAAVLDLLVEQLTCTTVERLPLAAWTARRSSSGTGSTSSCRRRRVGTRQTATDADLRRQAPPWRSTSHSSSGWPVIEGGPTAPLAWSHIGPRIDLESADFNERFDVYCDDPVRARMVLNPR
jgi:hypothetical protein